MSRTVRINPLLVLLSILVAASIGSWIGGLFGGFVAALLAIPAAGALQVIVTEIWRDTAPPPAPDAATAPAADGAAPAADSAAEVAPPGVELAAPAGPGSAKQPQEPAQPGP